MFEKFLEKQSSLILVKIALAISFIIGYCLGFLSNI